MTFRHIAGVKIELIERKYCKNSNASVTRIATPIDVIPTLRADTTAFVNKYKIRPA